MKKHMLRVENLKLLIFSACAESVTPLPSLILCFYVLSVSMNNIISWILSLLILSNFLFHISFLDLLFSSVSPQGQYACTKTKIKSMAY